jgi:hypothetical protein
MTATPVEVFEVEQAGGSSVFDRIDRITGALLTLLIVASPWLFGTTELWSIWIMNTMGYGCGLLLVLKWLMRWRSGALAVENIWRERDPSLQPGVWMVRSMVVLTGLVLVYCFVSAANARASFYPAEQRLDYYERFILWLPHTYDRAASWQSFWNYAALACFFWSIRDWLLHPPRRTAAESEIVLGLPPRFRALFWIIALNTTAVALEGIFQRLSGTDKLLWLRQSYDGTPESMFGPFAFSGNAAQYFNLAWPLILGFWWAEREKARTTVWDGRKVGGAPHILLLLCAIITASAPIVATSQGGSIVACSMLAMTLLIFLLNRRGNWRTHCTILLVCLSVLGLGGALGWDQLAPRLREAFRTRYANPNEVHENATQMALEYPLFGVGPGAFRAVYPMYRSDSSQPWQAFVHDDWMETRVTFGWLGSMLILCLLGLALTRWFTPGGMLGQWELVSMLWVAVGGCLVYAKFSFPLQVYSLLLLLLVHLAVLSGLSRPSK